MLWSHLSCSLCQPAESFGRHTYTIPESYHIARLTVLRNARHWLSKDLRCLEKEYKLDLQLRIMNNICDG